MKRFAVLIVIGILFTMSFAVFRDIPKGHWAETYVNRLAETGIATGFPDGTYRGDESVTRYQMALFLYRVLDYVSSELKNAVTPLTKDIELLKSDLTMLDENTQLRIADFEQMFTNVYSALSDAIVDLKEALNALGNESSETKSRLDLLDEYSNMIYDTLSTKASFDDLEEVMKMIDELDTTTNKMFEELQLMFEDLKVALDIHDSDILKIYDTLGVISEEIEEIKTILAGYVELNERLSSVERDVLNVKSTIETGLPALRDMVYELSANIAAVEERLTSYVEVSVDGAKNEVKEELLGEIQPLVGVLSNRVDLLEEYVNIMYETLGTKVTVDEIEMLMAELDERISAIETDVLNIRSTIETGLPAIRDMLYELSANLAAVEERLTSYVEASVESVIKGILDDLQPAIEDLKTTLENHDDRLNLVENQLVSLSQIVEEVKADKSEVEDVSQKVDALKAEKAQDVKRLEEMATWGIATGVIGIIIGIIGLGKAFGWF